MNFGSVFSGIEAATVAWSPLGWRAAFFSEIAKFPSAVLAHHYPDAPNYGDILNYEQWPDSSIDVLCGGPPCQSDSVAGKRGGMADPRGALKSIYVAVVRRFRPRWVLFEGVPGVRSVDDGRAFGALVAGLAEFGYGVVWGSLDAQYRGLAQRRERVFALGYLGAWQPAAAVLFDTACMCGNSAPSREARENVAGTIAASARRCSAPESDADQLVFKASHFTRGKDGRPSTLAPPLSADADADKGDQDLLVMVPALSGALGALGARDAKGQNSDCTQGPPLIAFTCKDSGGDVGELSPTLRAMNNANANAGGQVAVAFNARQDPDSGEVTHPLDTDGYSIGIGIGSAVRRLTPRECERLQGFPDDYTLVPYRGKLAADGPRYAALGNSWAVPVVRWIGERIAIVDAAIKTRT